MDAATLFARIRRRLDLEPSEVLDDTTEIGATAEESYFDLWDILCGTLGDEAPWERTSVSTMANQDSVSVLVTTGIYRIVRMDFLSTGGYYTPINRGALATDSLDSTAKTWEHADGIRYYARRSIRATLTERANLSGGSYSPWAIHFDPPPAAVYSVRIYYVPPPRILWDDSPAGYVSFPDEWPEYVVADCCAKFAARLEMDPTPFERERERIRDRIERYTKPHQISQPARISDQRARQELGSYAHPAEDFFRRRG